MFKKIYHFIIDRPECWSPSFIVYDLLMFLFDVFILHSQLLLFTGIVLLILDCFFYADYRKEKDNGILEEREKRELRNKK